MYFVEVVITPENRRSFMKTQCPHCKKAITLTTSQLMNTQARITCPGCHRPITTQSTIKKDVNRTIKQATSGFKLK